MDVNETKIILVDDHVLVRKGLSNLIAERQGFLVVGETGSGQEALQLVRTLMPDVVVMDILLGQENGIEISRQILAEFPSVKIVILSSELQLSVIRESLQAGVSAYVIKTAAPEELLLAIAAAMDNRLYLCPQVASEVLNDYMNMMKVTTIPALKPILTDRERHLLKLVAEGKRNKEIADALNVGVKSVETYRSRLMKKLGCTSSSELVRYAIKEKIIAV